MTAIGHPEAPQRAGPATAEGAVRLELLGTFRLSAGAGSIALTTPAQRLLAYLALSRRRVLRVRVAATLWLDSSEERAFGSLRSALWRLRRAGGELVEATSRDLCLAPNVVVDVREVVDSARRALDPAREPDANDAAAVVGAGELLPDWYDDWVVMEREWFRQLRLHALEGLCDRLTRSARYAEASEAGVAAVRDEPLRESAHRALIHMHLAEGNRAEAVRQYEFFARRLRRQLGAEPSAELYELVRARSVTRR